MIRRTSIALFFIGAALMLGATACGGDSSSSSGETTTIEASTTTESITAESGPSTSAELDAESVKAGTYTLKVEDKSDIHNFHLIGPGVDKEVTTVPFQGDQTVTVTLE